ncbi:tRNA (uridine(34)/cytosine(34)/5-carboxymethylaminomethyluridine(34)-2'-O)-methyltransferase TrmL [Hippea alviniae]|uniref:tRNA (uridine(34)/cytosine(34)/5- carboxymethylaminomethyluridine(34)-2'-O)- methyltransferase TrmL n=1 Tax=Hippea alviniae TaxID=1279027 RepID=UPI00068767E9|nr:tRNA (uridine(34)/cytosine(34)/5-carboxymethylaminomethyluridine(34)-2'-O)-methyltransferase TrmL [Hippea alviniae]
MERQFFLKDSFDFHVVLYQPDIPPNTGNIARLCVATNTHLHIIKPMGFSLDDKRLKRAGLDYWKYLKLTIHDSLDDFLEFTKDKTIYFSTTRAKKTIYDMNYKKGDFFMFGSETQGLPEELLKENFDYCINIPMSPNVRSINLSDSVSIVLYEAIRQVGF